MNRLSKIGASTTRNNIDGPRIVSPQKVEFFGDASTMNKIGHSHSHQTLQSKNFSTKPDFFEGHQLRGAHNNDHQQRPETSLGTEHGRGGQPRSLTNAQRPATSGDGVNGRQAFGQRSQSQKATFLIKKPSSTHGTGKLTGFFGQGANELEMPPETTKEDREAVEDLERWDSEVRLVAMSKAMESDQKKATDHNQRQFKGEKFETFKTPYLNREILNLIDEDEGFEKDGKYTSTVSNLNKQKARVPQKSLETIMTEYNKKILNEILYNRVSKKINSKDTPQNNKMDLDYATKSVSTDTISNFKNLQNTIQMNPRIIEYNDLYQKLTAQRNPPAKVFDFVEDRKRILQAENDYASIEAGLKVQFDAIISEIHKKKETLNDLRMIVHQNNDITKELQAEVDELLKKYEALEWQYHQQREQNKALNRTMNRKQRGGIKEPVRQTAHIEEYSKVQRQMDEKKDQVTDYKERMEALENETQKSQQKLSNLEMEIKDLKFKKNQLRLQLKQLYLKILKNEEHIFQNESSFITIIKSMWKINEEVVEDMFPAFIDKEAMAYLIENARLEYELDQLETFSKGDTMKEYQRNDPQQQEENYSKFMKTHGSLSLPLSEQLANVRKRLQNLKKGIVKMRRPVFIKDGSSKARVIRWEELSLETDDYSEPQIEDQNVQEKINKAVANIQAKLIELKEKEINRIFTLYINKEIEEKVLKNLNKLLISLFGRQDAEKIYSRFVRTKQVHDFKILQNKTFVFSSTKQFSNSHMPDKSKNSFGLMVSYASNFRSEKDRMVANSADKILEKDKKKEDLKSFAQEIDDYKQISDLEVNFNYNLNFNYASGLQSNDPKASFYVAKSSPTNDPNNMRGSMRDRTKMTRTANSFSKVTFKEPV